MNCVSEFIKVKGLEIHYLVWYGSQDSVVMCFHGASRSAKDWAFLAQHLQSTGYTVICPDMPGSGLSEWPRDKSTYKLGTLSVVMAEFALNFPARRQAYLGTSLGAAVALQVASTSNAASACLVINDLPALAPDVADQARQSIVPGLKRISEFLGNDVRFPTFSEFFGYAQKVYKPAGIGGESALDFVNSVVRRDDKGLFTFNFDRSVIEYRSFEELKALWDVWRGIDYPSLIIRGQYSDILPEYVAHRMCQEKKVCNIVSIKRCGHALALITLERITPIVDFIESVLGH